MDFLYVYSLNHTDFDSLYSKGNFNIKLFQTVIFSHFNFRFAFFSFHKHVSTSSIKAGFKSLF